MAYPYNLTNLLIASRELLQESTARFWTDAILTAYINEAIRTMAETTGCYRTIESVVTTPLTRLVSIAGYKCIAIEYNNMALIKITPLQIGHNSQDGITPQYWFEDNKQIGIDPIPPSAYTLTAYSCAAPSNLVSGTDVPLVPYALHGIIKYYVVAKALYQDKKSSTAGQYMGMFNKELDFMSRSLLPDLPDSVESVRFQ